MLVTEAAPAQRRVALASPAEGLHAVESALVAGDAHGSCAKARAAALRAHATPAVPHEASWRLLSVAQSRAGLRVGRDDADGHGHAAAGHRLHAALQPGAQLRLLLLLRGPGGVSTEPAASQGSGTSLGSGPLRSCTLLCHLAPSSGPLFSYVPQVQGLGAPSVSAASGSSLQSLQSALHGAPAVGTMP